MVTSELELEDDILECETARGYRIALLIWAVMGLLYRQAKVYTSQDGSTMDSSGTTVPDLSNKNNATCYIMGDI